MNAWMKWYETGLNAPEMNAMMRGRSTGSEANNRSPGTVRPGPVINPWVRDLLASASWLGLRISRRAAAGFTLPSVLPDEAGGYYFRVCR